MSIDCAGAVELKSMREGCRLGCVLISIAWLAVVGCGRDEPGFAPQNQREALEQINGNLRTVRETLHCPAVASFRFVDENGKTRQFLLQEALLVFRPPQFVRLDIRSLAGTIAQFGSNQERYWLWVEPETQKLWWGSWANLSRLSRNRLPAPPNLVIDALMLRPIDSGAEGSLPAMLRVDGKDQRLVIVQTGVGGLPTGWREIRFDDRPPHQPREVIDRLVDGRVVMRAELRKYERVGADGPLTPRQYVVNWPIDGAELRLDISSVKFRPDLGESIFAFPPNWSGAIEALDEPERSSRALEHDAESTPASGETGG